MIARLIKGIFRKIVFPIAYYCRFHLLYGIANQKKCMIINYHGVIEKENLTYNGRHFSKDVFERHLAYYKKHFQVVTISEIFEIYRNKSTPPKKTIAITFDDGFENNFSIAYPLLKKYNLPATFFISGVCSENKQSILWPEVINILRQTKHEVQVDNMLFVSSGRYNLIHKESNILLSDYIKQCNGRDRDRIINNLKSSYNFDKILEGIEPDVWELLDSHQIKEISESGLFEIGSHGYLHYNLANLTEEEATSDLKKSKEVLEGIVARRIDSVAFPDSSYNDKVKEICLSLGFKNMCAVSYQNASDTQDKNVLPRYGLSVTTNYYSNILFLHKAFLKLGF